jgi:hypothetical protein
MVCKGDVDRTICSWHHHPARRGRTRTGTRPDVALGLSPRGQLGFFISHPTTLSPPSPLSKKTLSRSPPPQSTRSRLFRPTLPSLTSMVSLSGPPLTVSMSCLAESLILSLP